MKKVCYLLLTLFLITFITDDAFGQKRKRRKRVKQRFRAGVLAGVNISQIDGDLYSGFSKFNFQAGVYGTARFTYQTELVIELLYLGKGSRFGDFRTSRGAQQTNNSISLNYVEVPFLIRHKFNDEPKGYFIEAGISFARLINFSIDQQGTNSRGIYFEDFSDDFNRNEFSVIGGLGFQFSEHFGMKIRASYGLNRFFDRSDTFEARPVNFGKQEATVLYLRNYRIGLSGIYFF
ncbi:MAG: porin family protein [Bacteroidota bacterium]